MTKTLVSKDILCTSHQKVRANELQVVQLEAGKLQLERSLRKGT